MSQSFPCLNPVCAHTFSAAELRAAGALKCPECGSEFQLRSEPTPPVAAPRAKAAPMPSALARSGQVRKPEEKPTKEKPAPPVAKPAPLAKPVASAPLPKTVVASPPEQPPLAMPPQMLPMAVPPHMAAGFAPPVQSSGGSIVSDRVRQRVEKKPWDWHRTAMIGGGVAVGISLLLLFYLILSNLSTEDYGLVGRGYVGRMYNVDRRQEDIFRLTLPEGLWSYNLGIRLGLDNAVVAMTRNEPEVWFAVGAKDYDKRSPRKSELLKDCVTRLESFFGDTLELAEKAENIEFAGQDSQRIEFRGEIKQVIWHGECYMFTHHGVGYQFFIAGPNLEIARDEVARFYAGESKFEIVNKRHGWRAQPPRYITTRGKNAPVAFKTVEGIFEQQIAADEDERGEILLLARTENDNDPNANRKNASILVLALDKAADLNEAMTKAVQHIQERKKVEDIDYNVVPVEGEMQPEFGKPADVGNRRGRILELAVNLKTEPKRYILLAVINEQDKSFVIRCDATWEARQIWREEFIDLLKQFYVNTKS